MKAETDLLGGAVTCTVGVRGRIAHPLSKSAPMIPALAVLSFFTDFPRSNSTGLAADPMVDRRSTAPGAGPAKC
jgi:hypothetical protein